MKNDYKNLLIHPDILERFVTTTKKLEEFHKISFDFQATMEKVMEESMKRTRKFVALNDTLTKAAEQPGVDLFEIKRRLTVIHSALEKKGKQTELIKEMATDFVPRMTQIRNLTKVFEDGAKQLKKNRNDAAASLTKMVFLEMKLKTAEDIYLKMIVDYMKFTEMMEEEQKVYNTLVD